MTTRGPTVCLAELGEESIQKQLCSCPHKKMYCSDNTILQNFIQNPWASLVVAVIKMNNILVYYLFLEITFPFLD